MTTLVRVLALSVWATVLTAQTAPQNSSRPSLRVGAASAIALDGRLDEPAWALADSIASLTQIEPTEGAPPAGRTVVRVLADAVAIIIGVRADDPEPQRITSFARERDAALDNEDHIRTKGVAVEVNRVAVI